MGARAWWWGATAGQRSADIASQIMGAAGGSANVAGTLLYGTNVTMAGGTVSAWQDARGGTFPVVTQATAAKQPTDSGADYVFDGVNDFLQGTYTLAQPFTRFMVVNMLAWTNGLYLYDGGTTDSTVLQQFSASPEVIIVAGAAGPNRLPPLSTYVVLTAVFNGASSSLQVNDRTASSGNAGTNNAGGLTIAARATSGNFNANIAVKAVVDVTVNDTTTRQNIKNVLYAAYGITLP